MKLSPSTTSTLVVTVLSCIIMAKQSLVVSAAMAGCSSSYGWSEVTIGDYTYWEMYCPNTHESYWYKTDKDGWSSRDDPNWDCNWGLSGAATITDAKNMGTSFCASTKRFKVWQNTHCEYDDSDDEARCSNTIRYRCCEQNRRLEAIIVDDAKELLNILIDDDGEEKVNMVLNDVDWAKYNEQCSTFDYDVYVHVNSHIAAVAMPNLKAEEAGCPPLAIHAHPDPNSTTMAMKKEVVALPWYSGTQTTRQFLDENAFSIAIGVPFVEIAAAFDNVILTPQFDLLSNNCGDFMKSFCSNLGVKLTPEFTSYVAKALMVHMGENLLSKMHANGYEGEGEALLYQLVESRTVELY